ncbi:DDE-type integrase/transposase/recombinase [Vibrio marinisediminis]
MDRHSRPIIGWLLDTTMTIQLITDVLKMAFKSPRAPKGVIIHSDRCVQYRAYKHQDLRPGHRGIPSMS